jgi:hypothetical protein
VVQSKAGTVEEYLAELPEDRRETVSAVRDLIVANLPDGYDEGMLWGMIAYFVPLSRTGKTYNGQPLSYVALASQKNYISLYLTSVYQGDRAQGFQDEFRATGKKLDMGKSCVRFRKLDDLPLDLIAREIASIQADDFVTKAKAYHAK